MILGPARRDVFFLGDGDDARFCLITHAPPSQCRGALMFVHPFAEEMNRSRRMVSLAAQAFAAEGWTVLQIDLQGCGDSAGDFRDASWQGWLNDLDRAHQWLLQQRLQTVALWSLRAGALLAADWLDSRGMALPWLNWQPVFTGAQYLTQFLRIRLGADLAASKQSSQALSSLRSSLKAGEPVLVGGYWLNADLAEALEQAHFRLPSSAGPVPMALVEVGMGDTPDLSPVATTWLKKASDTNHAVSGHAVPGAKFWQSAEVETAPELIPASLQALQSWVS
jgi:exosortase A-associated hydrolase 2